MRKVTLCLLLADNQILLAMKKRGFGAGKWNGFGGKVGEGEGLETAAIRELQEEAGIQSKEDNLQKVGDISFYFKENSEWNQQVHIFLVKGWNGEAQESEEMKPRWYNIDNIPYGSMWAADKEWLPLILQGKKIRGEVHFCSRGDVVEKFNWREM
ncbi:MAG: 8-oxo-dGTP diphosphatase [Candidatus Harrisonbacteria bacterium]|nr:8-oxo-dGTP diphosphatase [Candidatus Harrisonbacteria bacterium]